MYMYIYVYIYIYTHVGVHSLTFLMVVHALGTSMLSSFAESPASKFYIYIHVYTRIHIYVCTDRCLSLHTYIGLFDGHIRLGGLHLCRRLPRDLYAYTSWSCVRIDEYLLFTCTCMYIYTWCTSICTYVWICYVLVYVYVYIYVYIWHRKPYWLSKAYIHHVHVYVYILCTCIRIYIRYMYTYIYCVHMYVCIFCTCIRIYIMYTYTSFFSMAISYICDASCQVWMSHVTYEWVMVQRYVCGTARRLEVGQCFELCHLWMSHVPVICMSTCGTARRLEVGQCFEFLVDGLDTITVVVHLSVLLLQHVACVVKLVLHVQRTHSCVCHKCVMTLSCVCAKTHTCMSLDAHMHVSMWHDSHVCQDAFIYVTPRINASCHVHECVILLHMCDVFMRVTWRVRDMILSHVPYGAHTRLRHIDGAAHPVHICNVPHSRVWRERCVRHVPYPPVQHHTYKRMALTTSATVYKYSKYAYGMHVSCQKQRLICGAYSSRGTIENLSMCHVTFEYGIHSSCRTYECSSHVTWRWVMSHIRVMSQRHVYIT